MNLIKRIKSFLWRSGAVVAISVFSYLSNIGDIRELDASKFETLAVVAFSSLILGELTKYLNSSQESSHDATSL